MMHRNRLFLIVGFLCLMAYPSGSRALDLGLTPSHVYSLWIHINHSLIESSRLFPGEDDLPAALSALKTEKFSGKEPADVLGQLIVYRAKLDRLLVAQNLPESEQEPHNGGAITPSDVYLNSGHVLNAQVRWLIVGTGPEMSISQFYARHDFSGKTPSDVFALVDIANRRMDLLLRAAGI